MVFTELFDVLCELESILADVLLDTVTLILANLSLFHLPIKIFLQLILDSFNFSHLLLHLQEVVLFLC